MGTLKIMIIKSISTISLLSASVLATDYQWLAWKQQHKKTYSAGYENLKRYSNFVKNRAYVKKHNDEASQGLHSFTLGLNKFADLTVQEFEAQYTADSLPESIDWRYADQNQLNL